MVRFAASVAMLMVAVGCSGGGVPEDLVTTPSAGSSTGGDPGLGGGGIHATGGDAPRSSQSELPKGGSPGALPGSGGRSGTVSDALGRGGASAVRPTSSGGASVRGGSNGAGGATRVGGVGGAPGNTQTCASLPQVTDYGAPGPFKDAGMFTAVGPNGNYTLFRPDATLGQNGFLHPIAAWGNGISTTPDMYQKTLSLVASHGFVVIACNDTQVEEPCLSSGLDWLIQQNSTSGVLQGKLDTDKEVLVGYSWGGGASIDTAVRPNVKAVVSLHGMPPRQSPWGKVHAPLLLFTSTGDNFVTSSEYVTPTYQASTVQTFYATLKDSSAGHLYVVDGWSTICVGSLLGSKFGNCGDAALERAPTVAWLRMLACGDTGAKRFFYGDSCVLCQNPWTNPQRKNWQ